MTHFSTLFTSTPLKSPHRKDDEVREGERERERERERDRERVLEREMKERERG